MYCWRERVLRRANHEQTQAFFGITRSADAARKVQLCFPPVPVVLHGDVRPAARRDKIYRVDTLKVSERMLVSAFMASTPDHVYFKDRDSRFVSVSLSLARSFGRRVEEVIGRTDFDFFDAPRAREFREAEMELMRTGEAVIDRVVEHTWPDGSRTWSLNVAMPMRNEQGEIVGIWGTNKDITASKLTEQALQDANHQRELSRLAGMAEVATNVLHNVGNVLSGITVSADVITRLVKESKIAGLSRVIALLREHERDLQNFLSTDSRGRHVLTHLENLFGYWEAERTQSVRELESLRKAVNHVQDIVLMQQNYAVVAGVQEIVSVIDLVEDSIKLNSGSLTRHAVEVIRDFTGQPAVNLDRHKVLQILVNLIKNAKCACDESGQQTERTITLRVSESQGRAIVVVADNGVGIAAENLTRIFAHGFTTRKSGRGFGLHSGALAARELGGSLTAHSEGVGHGASFTLELPAYAARRSAPLAADPNARHE